MTDLLSGDALIARAEAAAAVALPDALGVEFLDPADPVAGVGFVVAGLAATPSATAHGAALTAAAELAGYLALLPILSISEHAVTHHVAIQFLRPAAVGQRVELVGHLERRARGVAFVSVTARVDATGVVAQCQITKSIVAF